MSINDQHMKPSKTIVCSHEFNQRGSARPLKKHSIRANIKICLSLLLSCLAFYPALAQHQVGIFENSIDIGNPKVAGSASYDESTQAYSIKGGGSNICFKCHEFHF